MTKFMGRLTELGITKESNRGVYAGPVDYWLEKLGFTFGNKANLVKSVGSVGSIAAVTSGYITERWAEGEIEAEVRDKSFGLILLAAVGAESSAVHLSARKHTYTLQNDNQHDSLSISYKDPDDSLIFKRAMLGSLTLNVRLDEVVSFMASFMSHASEDIATWSPGYVAENKFIAKHLSFKVADNIAGLNSETKLKELTLTIDKPLVRDSVLGSLEAVDILNTSFNISGTIVLNMNDKNFRDYALNGSLKAVRIELINTDRTIGTTNPAFRIDLEKVIFEEWDADKTLDDIVKQTLNFTAYYNLADSRLWSDMYLINEVASDY